MAELITLIYILGILTTSAYSMPSRSTSTKYASSRSCLCLSMLVKMLNKVGVISALVVGRLPVGYVRALLQRGPQVVVDHYKAVSWLRCRDQR